MAVKGLNPLAAVAFAPVAVLDKCHEVQSWVQSVASAKFGGMQLLEVNMKKLALAAALTAVTSTAFAGGVVETAMVKDEVVAVTTSSSGGGLVVPLLLILLLAAASMN